MFRPTSVNWPCLIACIVFACGSQPGFLHASTLDARTSDQAIIGSCVPVALPEFESPKPTALIVLSPRMPYALREWGRLKDLAEREGFRVVTRRDPRVPESEWRQAQLAVGIEALAHVQPIDGDVAAGCGLLNHAPAALVGRCGAVHPWPILGVMPDNSWRELLQSRLASLSGACG